MWSRDVAGGQDLTAASLLSLMSRPGDIPSGSGAGRCAGIRAHEYELMEAQQNPYTVRCPQCKTKLYLSLGKNWLHVQTETTTCPTAPPLAPNP
jgi:hypothetical protein